MKCESKKWNIILLLALGLCSGVVHGQFMRLNIEVKAKSSMEQIAPFAFDNTAPSSYIEAVSGSQSLRATGVYSLVGRENISVMVRVEAPDVLVDGQNNTIPFELTMAWQNDGTQGEATAKPAKDNKSVFPLSNSGRLIENIKGAPAVLHAYIFLKGTAIIPKTATSPYEGKVHLIVEYE